METNTNTIDRAEQIAELGLRLTKLKMPCNIMWAQDVDAAKEMDVYDTWFIHIDMGEDVDFSEELYDKCQSITPQLMLGWDSRGTKEKYEKILTGPVKFETLYSESWRDNWQKIGWKEDLFFGDHKLNISICCDSVEKQNYARISKWDGNSWNSVETIHWSNMNSQYNPRYNAGTKPPPIPKDIFRQDISLLKSRAVRILS